MAYKTTPQLHKLILLGDSNVGKTSIINRYVSGQFNPYTEESTVINQQRKKIDATHELQIWDTLGQELYRSLNRIYFRDTSVCCLVVDVAKADPCRALDVWWFEYLN